MSTTYITLTQLKSTLNLGSATFADADLTAAIAAASRTIDKLCDRRFYLDSGTVNVRVYTPNDDHRDAHILDIDDLATLTSVAGDNDGSYSYADSWVQNREFKLLPMNAPADGEPWTQLRVLPLTSQFQFYPWIPGSIQVTGAFGWPTVPDMIVEATTFLANRLAKLAREAPFGVANYGDMSYRIAQRDPTVSALVRPYKRYPFAIG